MSLSSVLILALRAEIAPQLAYTMNEVLYHYIQASGTFRFHITDDWATTTTATTSPS